MAYPLVTGPVLQALGYDPLTDCELYHIGNAIVIRVWNHADLQPAEQQVIDYANDVTPLPSGQLFSQWLAEHGGDPVATFRRQAKEALDKQSSETEGLIRALALVVLDEINTLRGQHALAPRTAQQLRDAIKNKLTAGDADS